MINQKKIKVNIPKCKDSKSREDSDQQFYGKMDKKYEMSIEKDTQMVLNKWKDAQPHL